MTTEAHVATIARIRRNMVGNCRWAVAHHNQISYPEVRPWPVIPPRTLPFTTDKKALQRHLGVAADGDVGPDTIKALQWRVGVTQSGVWGAKTTKGLQRALNANTF